MKAFTFAPDAFADEFRRNNYLLVKNGVDGDLLRFAREQLTQCRHTGCNELLAREIKSKKKQYLFELPADPDFLPDLARSIGDLANLSAADITLSERHIMVYDDLASSVPSLHKDRFATQIAVGIPLEPCPEARVVLLPHCARSVNSLDNAVYCPPANQQETRAHGRWNVLLDDAQAIPGKDGDLTPVELDAQPGDVIIFAGSSIYHGRVTSAGSAVLYLKFNAMHLDPLGEDPSTTVQRSRSLNLLGLDTDEQLLFRRIVLSPRLQRISRHYTRADWTTILQAYVGGEKEFTISDQDLAFLLSLREQNTVKDVLLAAGVSEEHLGSHVCQVRRLGQLGAIDVINQEFEVGLHLALNAADVSHGE